MSRALLRAGGCLVALLLAVGLAAGCGKRPPKAPKDRYSDMSTQEIYDLAMKRLEKGRWYRCRDALQSVLSRTDTSPEMISSSHLALADAYFHDGGLINLAEALSRYTNFITFYPNHEKVDYAQYQVGLCHLEQALSPDRDQAQTVKALNELLKVESNYPNSPYSGKAAARAEEARELLAEHDFRIAAFYYRGRAYTAAVERFRQVLDRYPRFSRKDRLYLLLGQALMGLKKSDEGRLYLEKLVAEFPLSRHAEEARLLLEETFAPPHQAAAVP